jgi:hypothetical protein
VSELPTLPRFLLSVALAVLCVPPAAVHALTLKTVDVELEPELDLPDPRTYLYQRAPDLAPRLDCIISLESGWDPNSVNRRSRASGLAQFVPSTWASTPAGQAGLSPFEPYANIDAAIWLARTKGWNQWEVYLRGNCR